MPIHSALARVGAILALMVMSGSASAAEQNLSNDAALGARLEPLLNAVQTMSPTLSAAALTAEAALNRVDGAGTLPDPTFRVQLKDIDREPGGILPQRFNRIDYTVEQEFPLWGKRGIARDIAGAQASQAGAERDTVKLDLLAAVKQTFAAYYVAYESIATTRAIRQTVTLAAEVAQKRYEQTLGSQQDAIMLKVEVADLDTAIIRKETDERRAAAKLNALLNRSLDAPLAVPEALPALPSDTVLSPSTLFDRARGTNPRIKALDATINAAYGTKTLAEKSWYPDVTLGLSIVDQSRHWQGYEAMVSVKIPLNNAQRRAETSATTSELGAARNKRDAALADLRGGIETSYWNFTEAQRVAAILHESHIPQAELALKSALSGYAQNRVTLTVVLDASRHALQNQLEHLTALYQQQIAVAEIERLVGAPL